MTVGIDIGGTKTHIAIRRDLQNPLVQQVVPSSSWRRGGLFGDEKNPARLMELVRDLSPTAEPAPLVVGAHGCDTREQCEHFASLLSSHVSGPVRVVNDAELLIPASGHTSGIAIIAGTGSIVVGTATDTDMIVSGGHGWLFGDPGSAPALVRDAVRAVLAARDRGEHPDELAEELMSHFGVSDVTELIYALSVAPAIDDWAQAAPEVFAAAERGSALAVAVIDDAAAGLAENVEQVIARGADPRFIVCAGGVMTGQPRLFDSVRRRVAEMRRHSEVELLGVPPVHGALALADGLVEPEPLSGQQRRTAESPR